MFSVLAGPQVVSWVLWSGPIHAVVIASVFGSMWIVYVLRTPIAKISGLALPSWTGWLSGANRVAPLGALEPGIVYVDPTPGVAPGLSSGWMRTILPS